MTQEFINRCINPTGTLTVKLPCTFIETSQRHTGQIEPTVENSVIITLDRFLRKNGRP